MLLRTVRLKPWGTNFSIAWPAMVALRGRTRSLALHQTEFMRGPSIRVAGNTQSWLLAIGDRPQGPSAIVCADVFFVPGPGLVQTPLITSTDRARATWVMPQQ